MSDLSKLHILLVDDIKSMRSMIRGILFKVGIQKVSDAANGHEGISVLKQENIDLIISDWNMPGMDGLEFLKAVRADETFKDLPFIMVTAENAKEMVVEAIQNGVSEFVAKPFTEGTIREKIEKVLNS
ncbi:MAG: response regulator [Gammaproteobacteria bacterium]|nr:response regulator [Gammaproteobacteria bacterium]